MVTTDEIISIGFKQKSIIRNGGSKTFSIDFDDRIITILSNSDNHRYIKTKNPRLIEIELTVIFKQHRKSEDGTKVYNTINYYRGTPAGLEELKQKIKEGQII